MIDLFKILFGNFICFVNNIFISLLFYFKYYLFFNNKLKIYESILKVNNNFSIQKGKIVNYNLHYWYGMLNNFNFEPIMNFLKEENAEIYVLQEFVNFKLDNNKEILFYIKDYLGTPYHHQEFIFENNNMSYVNIILSKNPILDIKKLEYVRWYLRTKAICFTIKTKLNDNIVWISNVHLNSDITGYNQNLQCKELKKYIYKLNEKHILVGDFNSPRHYKSIKSLKKSLKIYEDKNKTYPSLYPVAKLDYCFTYHFDNIENIEVRNVKYSDHLPLIIYTK